MLPDRENLAAAILENKCQNPRQTRMLVITTCRPLNVTLAKIRQLKGRHQRPQSDSEGLRVNKIIFGNLRKTAVPSKSRTTALLKYLSVVPVTDLSHYFLWQRPETVWAALAKQKQRGGYWELTREKEQGRACNHSIREKAQPARAFNAAI